MLARVLVFIRQQRKGCHLQSQTASFAQTLVQFGNAIISRPPPKTLGEEWRTIVESRIVRLEKIKQ
jgi:hypothetical protein